MSIIHPLERTIAHSLTSPPSPSTSKVRKPKLLDRIKGLFRKRRRSRQESATPTPDADSPVNGHGRTAFEVPRPHPVFHRSQIRGLPVAVIEDPPAPPYQEVEEPAPPRYPTPPRRREQIDAEVVLRYAFENQRPVFGVSFFVTGDLDEYLYVDNVTWVDDAWR